jgi:hypothetical protein
MRKSSSPLIAEAPHIAQSRGNPWRNGECAGCADQAHIAQIGHKSLKKHDRTKPHLARFYLAIVRLCCLLLLFGPPSFRQSTLFHEMLRTPSSRPPIAVSGDKQASGLRSDGCGIAHRS